MPPIVHISGTRCDFLACSAASTARGLISNFGSKLDPTKAKTGSASYLELVERGVPPAVSPRSLGDLSLVFSLPVRSPPGGVLVPPLAEEKSGFISRLSSPWPISAQNWGLPPLSPNELNRGRLI